MIGLMLLWSQDLVEQSHEVLARADSELVQALRELPTEEPISDSTLNALSGMTRRAQATALRQLEASYARFQRGVVLVVGEEQESNEMAKLVKEVLKLIASEKGNDDGKGKKKKNKKQQQKNAK